MSQTFLRRVLAADAASCVLMGALMVPAAGALASLLGLPADLIRGAGLLLLPLALFIAWLAARPLPPRPLVWVVILGNLAWTAESFVVIAMHGESITATGTAFVAAQALAVAALAALEYLGLRQTASAGR